jgi:Fe-S cluster assembly iron-binding protein IscA
MRDFRVPHQAEVRAEVAFDFAPSSELPMIFRTYSFVARRPGTVRLVQAYTKTHEVFIDFPKEPIKGDYIIAKLRYHHNEVTYYKAVNIINDSNNNPTINDRHIDWLSEAVDSDFRFDLIGRFRGQKIDDFSVNSVVELDRILYLKLQRSTTGSRYFFETINRIR